MIIALGVALSSWYYRPTASTKTKRRWSRKPIAPKIVKGVIKIAEDNPWYGYKRIAVMCRRAEHKVSNRQVYWVMRDTGLLQQRKKSRDAELHQTSKLYELLPTGPNGL